VYYSRRRQITAELKARHGSRPRRASGGPSGGRGLLDGGLLDGGLLDGGTTSPPASAAEAEAEKIVRLLNERATAARAETVWATGTVELAGANGAHDDGTNPAKDPATTPTGAAAGMLGPTGWLEPLKSTWSRSAIAALIIPALILLIVCLV